MNLKMNKTELIRENKHLCLNDFPQMLLPIADIPEIREKWLLRGNLMEYGVNSFVLWHCS